MTRKQLVSWIADAINNKAAGEREAEPVLIVRAYHVSDAGLQLSVADGTSDVPRQYALDLRRPR